MSLNLDRRTFLKTMAASVAGLLISTRIGNAQAAPAAKPIVKPESPKTALYRQSPILDARVEAETLPPVEQRLPTVPLVLTPIDVTGAYGGRLRQFCVGSWTGFFQEEQYGHSALRWVDDGLAIAPGICDTWSANADNTVWTIHIREGLKWSDGQPCNADDVLFWWNDLTGANNPGAPDALPDFGMDNNGQMAVFTRIDNYTLTITYATPAPLTAKRLAMWVNANIGPRWIAPKHYLSQFVPKYSSEIDWADFNDKSTTWTNPDCPSLNAWQLTQMDGATMTAERNPYYYAVDPQGNQLPYIDGQDWKIITDFQVEKDMVKTHQVDYAQFHDFGLGDIAGLIADATTDKYEVYLWDSGSGTGEVYYWNYDYPDASAADKKLHDLYRDPVFKQAMSFALDRPTIQHDVYYDTGILTTGTLSPKAFEFNFNSDAQAFFKKAREIYSAYDPQKAKELLDQAGYVLGTGGFRTFKDGSPMQIQIDLQAGAGPECLNVLAIAKKNWADIGLKVIVNELPPNDFTTLWENGKGQIHTNWEVGDGPDHLLYPSWMVPNEPDRWAPLCGRLMQYKGTPDEFTESALSPWDRNPPRFNANDLEYKNTPVEQIHTLFGQAILEPDATKRAELVWQMWQIHEDQGPFFIGMVANYPHAIIKSLQLTNVPTRAQLMLGGFVNPWIIPSPAITNPETWSFLPAVLNVLDPVTVVQNSSDFILTVSGKGFTAGSTVRWNGSGLATTYVSATKLTAAVPAARLTTAGTADVTVYNPALSITETNAQTFTVTAVNDPSTLPIPVDPTKATTQTFTSAQDPALTTTLAIPTGAVANNTLLVYADQPSAPQGIEGGFQFAGRSFSISAYDNGTLKPGLTFEQPVTITLSYPDGMTAEDLKWLNLRYWDTAKQVWSTEGIEFVSNDPVKRIFVFKIHHLSQFALLVKDHFDVYLPFSKQ